MVEGGKGKRFLLLFGVVFSVLFFRLWQLQVLKAPYYQELSERNRLRMVKIAAPRGRIYDSKGRILASNRPSFDLLVVPADVPCPEDLSQSLAEILKVDQEEVLRKIRGARWPYQPVRIKKDLSFDELSLIEANLWDLPGVRISLVPVRTYPNGPVAPHLLGMVGEISEDELRRLAPKGYEVGDFLGKGGLEAQWEELLRGRKGARIVEVNALGREVGVLKESEPQGGWDLYLTIDLELQKKAEELLRDKRGVIVVLDPRDGRVLAMASSPSFDPMAFSRGVDFERWEALTKDPGRPLTNRALQGLYSPGSVFKVVVALAGLKEGKLPPEVLCPGFFTLGRKVLRCWREEGHGRVDLYRAIVESCDVYFYQAGLRLGPTTMANYAKACGFGSPTGIKLPGERAGYVPVPVRGKWFDGDTAVMAIGQGPLLVTPLQMARFIAAVANGGVLLEPLLVQEALDPLTGQRVFFSPRPLGRLPFGPEEMGPVKEALLGVVEEDRGTGRAARLRGIRVAGKTGTAQVIQFRERVKDPEKVPYERRDHAWFVAYAPADSPSIAVAVLVEHGGSGGRAAAPLAGELIGFWLGGKR